MKKTVIGILGEMGSGKSTVSAYLKDRYGASHYRFSDILKQILDLLYLPASRENLIDLVIILTDRFGRDVLARPMKAVVENDANNLIVVEGIRRPEDIHFLRQLPDFYLLGIKTGEQARFERITSRSEKPGDRTKTYEEFKTDEAKQTETQITAIMRGADHVIQNDGTLEDLYARVDDVLEDLQRVGRA